VSGILDKKKRILDFIITEEGRNQAANGELRIHYASFSDSAAFYTEISGSYADDITNRIQFECNVKPQDAIVLENPPVYASDTIAKQPAIRPFQTSTFKVGGSNVQFATPSSGSATTVMLTGSQIPNIADDLCSSLSQNFKDMQIIGTFDPFDDSSEFEIFPSSKEFTIKQNLTGVSITSSESIFQDAKFQHLPNYMYLPPVNKSVSDGETLLGEYTNYSSRAPLSLEEVMRQLEDHQSVTFEFAETSRENNVIIQPIEFKENDIKKLAIIDYGEFIDNDPESPGKRLFFVGKIYADSKGNTTYKNIFTVIMD
tara:strand:- start:220 stop:1158 length:939 start_codon:yes stop_codon:yes gene_type:complete